MKIFCILNNYGENAGDLDWYVVPDSGILRHDNPMFVPDFDTNFRGYPSLMVKICKLGKNISPKFAERYYDEVAPGVALQASGLLEELIDDRKPWTRAVVFDKCCLTGEFKSIQEIGDQSFEVSCGETTIKWDPKQLTKGIGDVIAEVSRENILKTGDLILVGLTNECLNIKRDSTLSAKINGKERLQIRFK